MIFATHTLNTFSDEKQPCLSQLRNSRNWRIKHRIESKYISLEFAAFDLSPDLKHSRASAFLVLLSTVMVFAAVLEKHPLISIPACLEVELRLILFYNFENDMCSLIKFVSRTEYQATRIKLCLY